MLRAYIRPDARFSAARQRTAIEALGKKIAATYVEIDRRRDDNFPERDAWISSLRPGNIAVVSDFHRLATTADTLKEVRSAIHQAKAVIVEASTGRRSDDPESLADMTHEAVDLYRRRGLTKAEAKRLGRLGAAASPTAKAKRGRMPKGDAAVIWRDAQYTSKEAIAVINANTDYKDKYNLCWAYRNLGPRGVPAGRHREPNKKPLPRGYIYFVLAGVSGAIKIGYSAKPSKRVRALGTSHHEELECIFTMRGTQQDEKALHKRFAEFRKRGEWFEYAEPIKRFIASKRRAKK